MNGTLDDTDATTQTLFCTESDTDSGSDSDASSVLLLENECAGCERHDENQVGHYRTASNPHGCFASPTRSPPRALGCFVSPAGAREGLGGCAPPAGPWTAARMMHLHAHARAELLGAMQRERQARIVWTAVQTYCNAHQIARPTGDVVADTAYDVNVEAAARTLVTMGVPLRHLALAERISLQAPQHTLIDTFY